jgi:hypothetical protein
MHLRAYFPVFSAMIALSLAGAGACTSTNVVVVGGDGGGGGGVDDAGDGSLVDPPLPDGSTEDAKTDAPPGAKNPYGIPYPNQFLGLRPRSGSTRGDVLADLSFTGYLPNATTTSTVRLASVFDPEGRTHDVVALVLVAAWDTYSNAFVNALSALPARVAVLTVLGEGMSPGAAATASNLDAWHTKRPTVWNVLDPAFAQFGTLFTAANAVPVFVILDARTMEIVSAEPGLPPNTKQALEDFATTTKARAPSY